MTLRNEPSDVADLTAEQVLATRIKREREQRGWTYRGLAKLLKEQPGCEDFPHNGIQRIEQGLRDVKVNELAGLSLVFGRPASNLLMPIELLRTKRATRILATIEANEAALFRVLRDRLEIACELTLLSDQDADPRLLATIESDLAKMTGIGDQTARVAVDGREIELSPAALQSVVAAMDRAMWGAVRSALEAQPAGGRSRG